MFNPGHKDAEHQEYDAMLSNPKQGSTKPSDVRNGDLVSLLLAATPPYLYNMPLVPQSFFFSEMLRSFVQAKAERQNLKTHQVHRRRKRTWRESTPPESDKPLELTTPRAPPEKPVSPPIKKSVPSCDFTAETLANSSVPHTQPHPLEMPPTSGLPLWYPNSYPSQLPYPIDPLHFFIDLRVSAHIWDRQVESEKLQPVNNELPQTNPADPASERIEFGKTRHKSAFSVPGPARTPHRADPGSTTNKQGVHYIMSNIKSIFVAEDEENIKVEKSEEEKKDLRAQIGLELVADYVKQESDSSDVDDVESP